MQFGPADTGSNNQANGDHRNTVRVTAPAIHEATNGKTGRKATAIIDHELVPATRENSGWVAINNVSDRPTIVRRAERWLRLGSIPRSV